MVIVLPLRKSSLRNMIHERHNDKEINLKVLQELKPIVCGAPYDNGPYHHGDIKVILKSKNQLRVNVIRMDFQ